MVFQIFRRLSRGRNIHIIPEVELEPSQEATPRSRDSDDSNDNDAPAMPEIVVTQTHSTDGVETKLTSSFDSKEVTFEVDEQLIRFDDGHERKVTLAQESRKLSILMENLRCNPSRDSTHASGMTSVSQSTVTMDVHECNSSVCTLCKADAKKNSITFINVAPLDTNMINKLRTQPAKWYELGRSFDDLYREANRPDRRRRSSRNGEVCEVVVDDQQIS